MSDPPSKESHYHKGSGKERHSEGKENIEHAPVHPVHSHKHSTEITSKTSQVSSVTNQKSKIFLSQAEFDSYTEILFKNQSKLSEGSKFAIEYSRTICTDSHNNVICTTESVVQSISKCSSTQSANLDSAKHNASMIGLVVEAGRSAKAGEADDALDCIEKVAEEVIELVDSPKKAVPEVLKVSKDFVKLVKSKPRRIKSRSTTGKTSQAVGPICGKKCGGNCAMCKANPKQNGQDDDEESSE